MHWLRKTFAAAVDEGVKSSKLDNVTIITLGVKTPCESEESTYKTLSGDMVTCTKSSVVLELAFRTEVSTALLTTQDTSLAQVSCSSVHHIYVVGATMCD